jgi:hypothetical protein
VEEGEASISVGQERGVTVSIGTGKGAGQRECERTLVDLLLDILQAPVQGLHRRYRPPTDRKSTHGGQGKDDLPLFAR